MNPVSLCIPRVFPNISEARIRRIFEELFLGSIARIDIVPTSNEKGEKFNRVFVHFDMWCRNENAQQALARLNEGKEIKIIYDEPWFWKVSLYRKREQPVAATNHHHQYYKAQPRIEFSQAPAPAPAPAQQRLPIAPALSSASANSLTPPPPQQIRNPIRPEKKKYNNKNRSQLPTPQKLAKRFDLEEGEIEEK